MFLIERLIGVVIYCFSLILAFYMIISGKSNYKKILNIYVFILAIMAYFYVPYKTADLYRINEMLEVFSCYDFQEFSEIFLKNTTSPVAYLIYWLFGRLEINRFLPAVVCFITYSIVFHIIKVVADRYKITKSNIALAVFFVMSTGSYIMVISNIRTMLALAIICFCFTRETIEKKFNFLNVGLYFLAILIHNLAVVVLGIRFLVFIIRKKKNIVSYVFTIIGALLFFGVTIKYGGFLISAVLEKAIGYINGEAYSYIWDYVLGFFVLLLEVYGLYIYRKTRIKDFALDEIRKFIVITLVVAIIFSSEFSIYYRLIVCFCPMLLIPFVLISFNNIQVKRITRYRIFFSISLLVLALSCVRGSMSSLKFFEL